MSNTFKITVSLISVLISFILGLIGIVSMGLESNQAARDSFGLETLVALIAIFIFISFIIQLFFMAMKKNDKIFFYLTVIPLFLIFIIMFYW